MAGWVLGFALLRRPPLAHQPQRPLGLILERTGLAGLLLARARWARCRRQVFAPNPSIRELNGRRTWLLMLGRGILIGFLHHSGLTGDPCGLGRVLDRAAAGAPLPAAIASSLLLLGIAQVPWWRRSNQPQAICGAAGPLLLWGTLMAMGMVWGIGANDGDRFRSLPLGSLPAAAGLVALSAGVLVPLRRPARLTTSR